MYVSSPFRILLVQLHLLNVVLTTTTEPAVLYKKSKDIIGWLQYI